MFLHKLGVHSHALVAATGINNPRIVPKYQAQQSLPFKLSTLTCLQEFKRLEKDLDDWLRPTKVNPAYAKHMMQFHKKSSMPLMIGVEFSTAAIKTFL